MTLIELALRVTTATQRGTDIVDTKLQLEHVSQATFMMIRMYCLPSSWYIVARMVAQHCVITVARHW